MRIKIYLRLMLVLAAFALLMLSFQDAHGEEPKSYFKTSVLDSRKTVIYLPQDNDQDKAVGFTRKSYLDSRKTVIYDDNAKAVGFGRKSYLDPRKTVIYADEED